MHLLKIQITDRVFCTLLKYFIILVILIKYILFVNLKGHDVFEVIAFYSAY